MKNIYFDNASSTCTRQEVLEEMIPYFNLHYGNSSGNNYFSRIAKNSLEECREAIALLIGAKPSEIFFTSGGTESNNLALFGYLKEQQKKNNIICCSSIEHSSVQKPFMKLETEGHKVIKLRCDNNGIILINEFEDYIKQNPTLISVMLVNNEIGSIEPIKTLNEITGNKITFHCDAIQAAGKIPINVKELGVDMLSISAHKFYGPKGIGLLFIKEGIKISPMFHGGGHERNIRPGTINLPGIVGLRKALELSTKEITETKIKIYSLEKVIIEAFSEIDGVKLNSPNDFTIKIPGILHFTIDGIHSKTLLNSYEMNGISISSGSACSNIANKPSYVLQAIGGKYIGNVSQLRISIGKFNTEEEVQYFVQVSKKIINKLRNINRRKY